jgi:hypothetical protein
MLRKYVSRGQVLKIEHLYHRRSFDYRFFLPFFLPLKDRGNPQDAYSASSMPSMQNGVKIIIKVGQGNAING